MQQARTSQAGSAINAAAPPRSSRLFGFRQLAYSLSYSLAHSLACSLARSLAYSLAHLLAYSLAYSS